MTTEVRDARLPVAPAVHRLSGIRSVLQVSLYLLLFVIGFEGLRRSVAVLSWIPMVQYAGAENSVEFIIVGLVVAFTLAVVGLICVFLFFALYFAWRSSRPAAVFSVSLGLYVWTILIALNIVSIAVSLPSSIAKLGESGGSIVDVVQRLVGITLLVGVAGVCVSVIRRTRQDLPGARVSRESQPALWKFMEETAAGCGVRLPGEVCWMPKANAQAMHVGGWLGFGGRPALGIGLPLLRVLTVNEFRAALAHEFHHLRRGDAFLFAGIYHACQDAERLHSQVFSGLIGTFSKVAFDIYASLLSRLSRPVIRGWEFEADAFASRVVPPPTMARALVKLELAQTRFDQFRRNWLDPVLESGYLPPVMRGFWEYYEQCALEERNYRRLMTAREVNRQSETHPSLRQRILRLSGGGIPSMTDCPAFDLVENPELVEAQVFSTAKQPVRQDEWGAAMLKKLVATWKTEVLAGTIRRRGSIEAKSLAAMCAELPSTAAFLGFDGRAAGTVERILIKSFAAALVDNGWEPVWQGGRLTFRKDPFAIDVAAEILRLKTRQNGNWQARCDSLGIGDLELLPASTLPGKGRFCSRCLRSFAIAAEFCPLCRKRLYA